MIIEVPSSEKGKSTIFNIIRNNSYGKYSSPAYFPYGENMISVFEKKDIEKKISSTLNEIRVAKYMTDLKKEDVPEDYIVIIMNGDKFSIIIKKGADIKIMDDFKSNIQSLVRIYENYKTYNFFFLKNEKLEHLIAELETIYSNEEPFKKISVSLEKKDYDDIQYNDSFLTFIQETKGKIFSRKRKEKTKKRESEREPFNIRTYVENMNKGVAISLILAVLIGGGSYAGWSYYQSHQAEISKKIKEEAMKKMRNFQMANKHDNFKNVNRNLNAYVEIERIVHDGRYFNFTIDQDRIKGLFSEDFEFKDGDKKSIRIADKRVAEILFNKKSKIKNKKETTNAPVDELLIGFDKSEFSSMGYGTTISKTFSEDEFLDLLEKISYNNKIEYTGFVTKKENGINVILTIIGK